MKPTDFFSTQELQRIFGGRVLEVLDKEEPVLIIQKPNGRIRKIPRSELFEKLNPFERTRMDEFIKEIIEARIQEAHQEIRKRAAEMERKRKKWFPFSARLADLLDKMRNWRRRK